MERWVRSTVREAKTNEKQKHLRLPEAAFLNGQVLPALFNVLTEHLSRADAQRALLNEYHRTMPDLSRQSPIRWVRHPFRKVLGSTPKDVYQGWKSPGKPGILTQSCPDFSLRDPFPHSILFEGKYFAKGSAELAQRRLVTDIYEAFFYRGLPALAATRKHPEWKYDYACLLVYDATPKSTFLSAWMQLDFKTRRSFWDGSKTFMS